MSHHLVRAIDSATTTSFDRKDSDVRALLISEIFFSVQGEGSRAGLPCIFVRLHGCGLRCSWCDTPYALDHREGGRIMSFEEISERLDSWPCRFVEFTGGEPLEQPAVQTLMTELLDDGYTVAIETGGHVDVTTCDPRIIRIVDMKAPGSGMTKRNRYENLAHLTPRDEVKFVCASLEDYHWSRDLILEHDLANRVGEVLISPVFGSIEPLDLVEAILKDGLPVRFQIQMHKQIWDPNARGV